MLSHNYEIKSQRYDQLNQLRDKKIIMALEAEMMRY